MLVKDSQIANFTKDIEYAIYRDLMNKGSLPGGFVEHRLNFVEKKV